jgi:hypothetical protein
MGVNMKVVVATDVVTYNQQEESVRSGATVRQAIFGDETADGLNFRVFRSQFQPGQDALVTPRHHHNFQQIRWAERGPVNYAPNEDIPTDDVAYFPRGAYYGPQNKDQGISIALQLGRSGDYQHGPKWEGYREEALARLNARGRFENGIYFEVDLAGGDEKQRDGVEALLAEQYQMHTGEKYTAFDAGYEAPVLIHTDAFEYFHVGNGVELKLLGRFFDNPGADGDTRISMIRLAPGAEHIFGDDRAQVGWVKGPGLRIGDEVYPALTHFYIPLGESTCMSAAKSAELRVVELPRL